MTIFAHQRQAADTRKKRRLEIEDSPAEIGKLVAQHAGDIAADCCDGEHRVPKTGLRIRVMEEDRGRISPIGFKSSLKRAVAIACLLHPQTIGLKCKDRTVRLDQSVLDVRSKTLDFLLTSLSGTRTYLFVKNDAVLELPKMKATMHTI